ncbi:MAG: GNAT family N-acetyltransferase [Bdellovibrionales bacterium]
MQDSLWRELQAQPNSISLYLAVVNGMPVSTGWTRFHDEVAWIFSGSTLPDYRRQGIYQDLLASRIKEAGVRGSKYVITDATDRSLPSLKKFGFIEFARTRPFNFFRRR